MTEAPALPFPKRRTMRPPAPRAARPSTPTAWSAACAHPIEIVSPDRECTALLLEYAAPLFPAKIVADSAWIVRLQPPPGAGWVLDLLSLVEHWLESARLPCAKVLYGGRSYLIRASTDLAQIAARAELTTSSTHAPAV
jgi:hypothetical protein